MKLISKTLQYYLFISLPLLLIAGLFSYYLIKGELRDGTDESLLKEKFDAQHLIKSFTEPQNFVLCSDSLSFITIDNTGHSEGDFISDTLIFDANEKDMIPYRVLNSYYNYQNTTYKITVLKTTIEEDELMEGLLSAFAIIIFFLVAAFFIVNWLLSRTLWKPFYKTLSVLNSYEIKNYNRQLFSTEKTEEFNRLNDALNKMTEKLHTDFVQQKEFIENASHEMQTPLAVIKANVSLLMQSTHINEQEMNYLQAIENTTKKLATLNKALLLLSKIENNQFKESETINLKTVIEKAITNFEPLIYAKKITLEFTSATDLVININPVLAEVLTNNLIQNAIRHNYHGGKIKIATSANSLEIMNTGHPLTIKHEDLFSRFIKNDASQDSLGLGLAIVKSVTALYNYSINYSFKEGYHCFTVLF